jgi:hypothetical protein
LGAGDSRHAISGEIARRLFGGRASHARSPIEGRQDPEYQPLSAYKIQARGVRSVERVLPDLEEVP